MISAILSNSYFKGFAELTIYQGPVKNACVPFLNCYSCPGAWASCPIGGFQSLLASYQHQVSFYIAGLLTIVGAMTGRLICGWLCPFGLVQELLGRLSKRKAAIPEVLKKLKFVFLVLTLALPLLLLDPAGIGSPYFCKFICPVGTLEGGLLLGLGRPELRQMLGWLFSWKVAVLVIFLVASIFTFRPFCQTTCPLGAFYALFNQVSLWRIQVDVATCISCGSCGEGCPLKIKMPDQLNHLECIRCLKCCDTCPTGALTFARYPAFTGKYPESN